MATEIDTLHAKRGATGPNDADGQAIRKKLAAAKDEHEKKVAEERQCRDQAKEQRAKGDAIYWPVFNLDRKNPNAKDDLEHLPPEQLANDILQKELRITEIMREIKELLGRKP